MTKTVADMIKDKEQKLDKVAEEVDNRETFLPDVFVCGDGCDIEHHVNDIEVKKYGHVSVALIDCSCSARHVFSYDTPATRKTKDKIQLLTRQRNYYQQQLVLEQRLAEDEYLVELNKELPKEERERYGYQPLTPSQRKLYMEEIKKYKLTIKEVMRLM